MNPPDTVVHGQAQTDTDARSRVPPIIYLKLLLTALFWGATFIAGRQVSQHLDSFTIAFLRFAMASSLLLLLTWNAEGRLPILHRRQILPVVLLGLTGIFLYNSLFFKGLRLIEASRAALIVATCPAFIAVTAALFLRERLRPVQMIGIPLSVLGAAVVISQGNLRRILSGGVGWGELFILGCVLSWTAYSLIGKSVMRRPGVSNARHRDGNPLSPLVAVCYSSILGAAALAIPAALEDPLENLARATWLDWVSIAYLAVFGTVIGFVWFYEGVKTIGTTRAGLFINFVPISAVILGALILHEPITASLAVGAVLVLSGVCLTNATRRPGGARSTV